VGDDVADGDLAAPRTTARSFPGGSSLAIGSLSATSPGARMNSPSSAAVIVLVDGSRFRTAVVLIVMGAGDFGSGARSGRLAVVAVVDHRPPRTQSAGTIAP